jgi:hypothetical protein
MGNGACFGARDGAITESDVAILDLRILQRSIRKRAEALEASLAAQKRAYRQREAEREPSATATGTGTGTTHRQRLHLRHIGALQKALDQCHVYSYRLDEMVLDIGEASTMVRVQSTMRDATRALDRMTGLLRVEDVEAMLEQGAGARERHREFQAALASGAAAADEFAVSEAELEALRVELEPLSVAWAADAPAVPTAAVAIDHRRREKTSGESAFPSPLL